MGVPVETAHSAASCLRLVAGVARGATRHEQQEAEAVESHPQGVLVAHRASPSPVSAVSTIPMVEAAAILPPVSVAPFGVAVEAAVLAMGWYSRKEPRVLSTPGVQAVGGGESPPATLARPVLRAARIMNGPMAAAVLLEQTSVVRAPLALRVPRLPETVAVEAEATPLVLAALVAPVECQQEPVAVEAAAPRRAALVAPVAVAK